MTKSHFVKKARKDNPAVKRGESYWWWSFMIGGRGGPKHYSAWQPKPSQLTSSEYLSAMLAHFEELDGATMDEDFPDLMQSVSEEISGIGEEQADKKSGMPEGLQEGPTGELLEARAEACQSMADELENAAGDTQSEIDDLPDFSGLEAIKDDPEHRIFDGVAYTESEWDDARIAKIEDFCQDAYDGVSQDIE